MNNKGKMVNPEDLKEGDRVSFFYGPGVYAGKVSRVSPDSIVLDSRREFPKSGILLPRVFDEGGGNNA